MKQFDTKGNPVSANDRIRAVLSLREAALLADVPEARLRKDVETGVVRPLKSENGERLLFRWPDVFLFAAIYKDDLLSSRLRRKVLERLEPLVEPFFRRDHALTDAGSTIQKPPRFLARADRIKLGEYLFIDVEKVIQDVAPRVDLYADGLTRIEEKENILGGEVVFKNTRLSVRHIGKMHDAGETIDDILVDYPYLRASDVKFARLYHKAHPVLGRPPATAELPDAGNALAG